MTGKLVLSVGQCEMDKSSINHLLESRFQAVVETADTLKGALVAAKEKSFDLILVNRVFDQSGELGLDFIRQFKSDGGKNIPVMLVSNFPEAQELAIQLGATPGFGKAALQSPATGKLLEPFLA